MKKLAVSCLIGGFALLVYYLIELCITGYINPRSSFSVTSAKEIAPFVGSFIGVFFSLAGTLLIFENLRMQTENLRIQTENNRTNQLLTHKNQFESIFFNLLNLQNQIIKEIVSDVYVSYQKNPEREMKGRQLFECLAPSITNDYDNSAVKTKEELIRIYNRYYAIHTSDIGHYYRNLYYLINYVDTNPYFRKIESDPDTPRKEDYINIVRGHLSNCEIICLAINGLSPQGEGLKSFIIKFELLKNIDFDFNLEPGFLKNVPAPEILIEEYVHIKSKYPH